jgi:superfamily II DNA or RNA helicase
MRRVWVRLEELAAGQRLAGVVPAATVEVVAAVPHGADAVQLIYRDASGGIAEEIVYRGDEERLRLAESSLRPFDAVAADFKLAAEAQRIRLAGLYDPMLAVATSAIEPLPHQIRAVYGDMLPRTPLRFLLADDPGAGKTIMAGLYIKELILRGDVQRCLVVMPGGLVEQWQDELYLKFGLRFDILDAREADGPIGQNVFDNHPLLIARMDQVARNDLLLKQLDESEYDLVIVDEAHRMSAHYFGGKLEKSKRFQLGERLGRLARHLLLMTATPHAGKPEDYQLFLSLLDRDRFEGRFTPGVHSADTQGLMSRNIKEDLLTFEGKPLFPERVAETVPYNLTDAERELYEQVTHYVREGMDRAAKLDDKRRNTVGFALTVLQRRLASSPEAIYQSLVRRAQRLERSRKELLDPSLRTVREQHLYTDADILDDPDEYTAAELEDIEEDVVDAATAARTVQELDAEIAELGELIYAAAQVRASETDRKWTELRTILEDQTLARDDAEGPPRKLIIFTEHRDTLAYLHRRIGTLLGKAEAVQAIHGGVNRALRRQITEQFTKNPSCQILLATDAAGEGLNLQAAHLMVNYDLPWNPNRIEQRFGRIHRIGQREVCRLWNIVAANTREGAVFTRLLEKIDEQRKAYGGKVFDVLGSAFTDTPLRELLIDAIRYGEQPEVRARMERVIDAGISKGLDDLMAERALANESLASADLAALRRQMDEAKARRLQPHYIAAAFTEAFRRLGGRIARREKGRYEITHVPAPIRQAAIGPVATRYERVTFDLDGVDIDTSPVRADLLAPGHPLHDTVTDLTAGTWAHSLETGTTLVSATIDEPRLLVGVVEQVVDATGTSVAKRFGYAFVAPDGTASPAGPAPYLDCVAAPDIDYTRATRNADWLADAEQKATSWIIEHQLPQYLAEVTTRRTAEITRATQAVKDRLNAEINRLSTEALAAQEKEQLGQKVRETSDSLTRKAGDLEARLTRRLTELAKQAHMTTKPPRVVAAALMLPLAAVDNDLPPDAPMHAVATKDVERRGVEAVLQSEKALGRVPEEQAFNNPGYDILSTDTDGNTIRIEVKARIQGAPDFFITHNEVLIGKNAAPHYRLVLVSVSPNGPEHDDVRYLLDPFAATDLGGLEATGLRVDWNKTWAKGTAPQ